MDVALRLIITQTIKDEFKNHYLTNLDIWELHLDKDVLLLYRYSGHQIELRIQFLDITDHKTLKTRDEQEKIKRYIKLFGENISMENIDIEKIDNFIDSLYQMRQESIQKDGEYGIGNLIFKEFRNLGYLDNLKDIKTKIEEKELSLKE